MSIRSRFGDCAPEQMRALIEAAYLKSLDKSFEQNFEALADVGEFNAMFPDLVPIATHPRCTLPNFDLAALRNPLRP